MMKPVYIDITSTPESDRQTGLAAALIKAGTPVKLLTYSVQEHAYRLIDSQSFISADPTAPTESPLLRPDDFEENTIFLDTFAPQQTVPARSRLLPILKKRRIQVICRLPELTLIRQPQTADSQTLLNFMEYLTAHMTCADKMIVPSPAAKADLKQLFQELDLPEKPITVADSSAEISTYTDLFSQEDTTRRFVHKPVKQIVFLSARPAPILATLPYIEEFMPFIKELVVCCPDPMADFMKENYKGRLTLKTITDGELLAGRELPPDHSTRNFFLRCLAMEQDIIDDEFIMSDDDYRPLCKLTEEFFYKDGKYRGCYFSDISRWKYKITGLFSYDYCHFRTLGFLQSIGCPTLQYSSHMPQIINRRWYLDLLKKHPDIRTKGYDEWSTYFNYITVEHPDQFQPCPYVTLSWPPIGGAPLGVVQPEYVFENFYSENYGLHREFSGCSSVFTTAPAVGEENRRKIAKAVRYREKFAADLSFADEYTAEYTAKYSTTPDISAYFHGAGETIPDLSCPKTVTLSRTRSNYIRFSVARADRTEANIANVIFELSVTDARGTQYCGSTAEFTPRLEYSHIYIKLPSGAPTEGLRLRVTAKLKTRPAKAERIVPVKVTD